MMKKLYSVIGLCLLLASSVGCTSKVDKIGWYHDFNDAQAEAQKKGKNIILFVSSFEDDNGVSSALQNGVFAVKEAKALTSKYACVNLNFSNAEYEKASVDPATATKKQQKEADKIVEKYQKNLAVVSNLAIQDTPALFLFTPEGYLISDIPVTDVSDYAGFTAALEEKAELETTMKNLVVATKTGTDLEKASAIDVLYEATSPESRVLLRDLIVQFNDLDKNNELGFGGKYVIAKANIEAQDAAMQQRFADAVQIFATAAESSLLDADQQQQAYYMAGYTLAQTGSMDIDTIITYFQKSYEAAPDSEYAPQIQQMIMVAYAMKQQMADNNPLQVPTEQGPATTQEGAQK